MTWREQFRPIIVDVIQRVGTADMTKLRQELREAFPAGPRSMYPYRVWLDEINAQLGLGRYERGDPPTRPIRRRVIRPQKAITVTGEDRTPIPQQLELF
jgi:hypothetical protein